MFIWSNFNHIEFHSWLLICPRYIGNILDIHASIYIVVNAKIDILDLNKIAAQNEYYSIHTLNLSICLHSIASFIPMLSFFFVQIHWVWRDQIGNQITSFCTSFLEYFSIQNFVSFGICLFRTWDIKHSKGFIWFSI